MKVLIALLIVVSTSGMAAAQDYGTGSNPENHYTSGYIRQNGTVVEPHYQTNPNATTTDNYETRGNYDPYTGHTGTRSPY